MLFLRSVYRVPHVVVGVSVLFCLAVGVGCAQSGGRSLTSRTAPQTSRSVAAKADAGNNVAAVASQVHMTFTDPKSGKVLWKATVGRLEAGPGSTDGGLVGTLHTVNGVLYEGGKAANRMIAPTVNVDNRNKIVTATGGVHVISLTQKDTDLRCDKAVWYITTNKLVGTGHVIMHKSTFTQTGPSFAADTRLQSVVMPAPAGADSTPTHGKRGVHAHIR